jgi:hypothetical protein
MSIIDVLKDYSYPMELVFRKSAFIPELNFYTLKPLNNTVLRSQIWRDSREEPNVIQAIFPLNNVSLLHYPSMDSMS